MSPAKNKSEVGAAFSDPSMNLSDLGRMVSCPFFTGSIDPAKLPAPSIDGRIHLVIFPFLAGPRVGLSIQLSRKHHLQDL